VPAEIERRIVAPRPAGPVSSPTGTSTLAYFLERHAAGTEIHTLGSAFFWTSTQLLTVSSQLKDPISFGGRALDIFMEVYAITP
jgi:hypothetical protein